MADSLNYASLLRSYERVVLDFSALFVPLDDALIEALRSRGEILISPAFFCVCEQIVKAAPLRIRETYRQNAEKLPLNRLTASSLPFTVDTFSVARGYSLISGSTLVVEANYSLEDRLIYHNLPADILSLFFGGSLIRTAQFPQERQSRALTVTRTPLRYHEVRAGDTLYTDTSSITLGRECGDGLESCIFEIEGRPHQLAKLYKEDIEDGESMLTEEKLQNIRSLSDVWKSWRLTWLALPSEVIYAGSDRRLAVGYTMRRFEDAAFLSDSLLSGGNILRIMAEHENTTVGEVLDTCIRLTRQVIFLSMSDIHLSDYNDRNFAIPAGKRDCLYMVDTDSYCSERYLSDCVTYAGDFSREYDTKNRADVLDLCDESLYDFVFTRLVLDSTFSPVFQGEFRYSEERLAELTNPNLLAKWQSIPPNLQALFRDVFTNKAAPSLERLLQELLRAQRNTAFSQKPYRAFYGRLVEQLQAEASARAAARTAAAGAGASTAGTGRTGSGSSTAAAGRTGPGSSTAATGRTGPGTSTAGTGRTGPGSSTAGTGRTGPGTSTAGTGRTGPGTSGAGTGRTVRPPRKLPRKRKRRRGIWPVILAILACLLLIGYLHEEGYWDWETLETQLGDMLGQSVNRYETDNGYYLNESESLDGYAEYYWDNGDVYKGDFVNGERTGRGAYTWASGDVYEGDFVDGICHGQGTYTWGPESESAGNVYTGGFVNGERTGRGTYTWVDGDVYEGDFVNGERTGQGTYTWANGDVYEGGFAAGVITGEGTYTWTDGTRYTGSWLDGLFEGDGTYYFPSGDGVHPSTGWSGGTLHGGETVSFTFEDGSPFLEGYWKENHFYGTYYDEDGAHTLPAA